MALSIGPFVGESLPLVVPITDAETGAAITNPTQVRVWVTGPDGTLLGDKTLTGGEVVHLGSGRFRAVFEATMSGVHMARSMVTGPDGIKKASHFEFEVYDI